MTLIGDNIFYADDHTVQRSHRLSKVAVAVKRLCFLFYNIVPCETEGAIP